MATDSIREVDAALQAIESAAGSASEKRKADRRPRKQKNLFWRTLKFVVAAVVVIALPFIGLLRISVTLHLGFGWNPWFAIGAAAIVTALLISLYVAVVTGKIGGRPVFSINVLRLAGGVVATYCLYAMIYISGANVKSDSVRSTYKSLHPVIRLSVATLIIIDNDLVVTDAARSPEDYDRMGLPRLQNSLHFVQSTGYVHAVDIRTVGIPEWQNLLVTGYFRLSGLNTLRHTGTADHLHVSLPVAD